MSPPNKQLPLAQGQIAWPSQPPSNQPLPLAQGQIAWPSQPPQNQLLLQGQLPQNQQLNKYLDSTELYNTIKQLLNEIKNDHEILIELDRNPNNDRVTIIEGEELLTTELQEYDFCTSGHMFMHDHILDFTLPSNVKNIMQLCQYSRYITNKKNIVRENGINIQDSTAVCLHDSTITETQHSYIIGVNNDIKYTNDNVIYLNEKKFNHCKYNFTIAYINSEQICTSLFFHLDYPLTTNIETEYSLHYIFDANNKLIKMENGRKICVYKTD